MKKTKQLNIVNNYIKTKCITQWLLYRQDGTVEKKLQYHQDSTRYCNLEATVPSTWYCNFRATVPSTGHFISIMAGGLAWLAR